MYNLDASGLLDVWERGFNLSPPRRALALLAYEFPDTCQQELAALPLGRCETLLQRLRVQLFGVELAFVASCPACASIVESTIDLSRMLPDADAPQPQPLCLDEHGVTFRSPCLRDLIGLPGDAAAARRALVSRCLLPAPAGRTATGLGEPLSDQALDAISAAMRAADPAAAAELELECPDCNQRWQTGFDIAAFLWREIDAWARRTLREVHALARAYAWSEQDVLALSPTRRQLYLELSRA